MRRSWSGDTLTATSGLSPSASHATIWRHAASSTHSPSSWIRPLLSATGMKSPGGIIPSSGSFQRSSASTPTVSPPASSTSGW